MNSLTMKELMELFEKLKTPNSELQGLCLVVLDFEGENVTYRTMMVTPKAMPEEEMIIEVMGVLASEYGDMKGAPEGKNLQ